MAKRTSGWATAIDGSKEVRLDKVDPADTAGLSKAEALDRIERLGNEFAELGNLLAYAGQHPLLIVLQGRDASGKDGTIRKMLEFSNIQSAHVHPFKAPTDEERGHDFLWRVHQRCPARGHLSIFNRSHYEDVLAARVHNLVPKDTWRARFDRINAFERSLADNGTILLKFYLHVSREEQYERLLEREKNPLTAWKLNPNDWRELALWDEFTEAYQDVLSKCATSRAPWHLVPADKKWFRNLAVLERTVATLRPYKDGWIQSLKERGKTALAEIRSLRATAKFTKSAGSKTRRHQKNRRSP